MSGVRAPHIQRREGVYYLRVRVPDAIRLLVGKTEIVRSLKTYSIRQARSRAAFLSAQVMEAFDMIKNTGMTPAEAREIVHRGFKDIIDEQESWGAFKPTTIEFDLEIAEQRGMAEDRIAELRAQIEAGLYSPDVVHRTRGIVTGSGRSFDALSPARQDDLVNGVGRALIEQQKLFMLRLEDRLASFTPNDPLFAKAETQYSLNAVNAPGKWKGPSLGDTVTTYLKAHDNAWRPRTHKARTWQLGYLVEFLEPSRPFASITQDDLRRYRDAVVTLRANHGYVPSQSFFEKQTDNPTARIKRKTADLIFQPVKTLFSWGKSTEGLIEHNPADGIRIIPDKAKKGERSRRPFEADEVVILYSCPLFTGCKSIHRRYDPGDKIVRDAKFWIPILGYYTGCRLGELVQLAIEDVRIDHDAPHLDINEKALIGKDQKSVKSIAGIRQVPLHPDLFELGFGEFVAKRTKQDKPTVRLFKDMKFGVDGQASTEYSKIFARMMEKVGLTDPRLVFHSWRHGVEDALRNAEIQPYIIDRIVGHADNTMGGKYGKGVSLEIMSEAVASMKLPVRLPELLLKSKP